MSFPPHICPLEGEISPRDRRHVLSISWEVFPFVSSSLQAPASFDSCQAWTDMMGVFKGIKRDPEVYGEHILESEGLKQNCFANFFVETEEPHEHKPHKTGLFSLSFFFPFLDFSFSFSFLLSFSLSLSLAPPFLLNLPDVSFPLCTKMQRNVHIWYGKGRLCCRTLSQTEQLSWLQTSKKCVWGKALHMSILSYFIFLERFPFSHSNCRLSNLNQQPG